MVLLLDGASHTGKTALAQWLMERLRYPYVSIDHLKMGLLRSGYCSLHVEDDAALTGYLWPIVREMIKTAIENKQNLIIEGCYFPGNWRQAFSAVYQKEICYVCLIMSPTYIQTHQAAIYQYASVIEQRLDDGWQVEEALVDNMQKLAYCKEHGYFYILIDDTYNQTQLVDAIIAHGRSSLHKTHR